MVFSSTVFLFIFLPAVYIPYLIFKNIRFRNVLLIIASLLFYAYGEPIAVLLMILSVIVNYLFGIAVTKKHKKLFLVLSVIFNVSMLFVFKYLCFTMELLSFIAPLPVPSIAMPIGISFFTFQAMSYVIDVYKKPELKEKNILNIFLYISLFPQLIAGPIIRFEDLSSELNKRTVTLDKSVEGMKRFIFGLSKKVLIANTAGQIADAAFNSNLSELSALGAWIGAAAYMLQIYYDFSGYSDMAIGLGKMFGFTFKENFNYPFGASSMQDFWRKWNISVSTWFKEYVYIPLGGNRKGKLRTNINKLIVFFLTGLWHGANLTFILWGMLHGTFLMLENYGVIGFVKSKRLQLKVVSHIYCILVIMLTFVVFRADNIQQGIAYYGRMFGGFGGLMLSDTDVLSLLLTPFGIITAAFAVVFSVPVFGAVKNKFDKAGASAAFEYISCTVTVLLFACCVLSLMTSAYNPFIYFRF